MKNLIAAVIIAAALIAASVLYNNSQDYQARVRRDTELQKTRIENPPQMVVQP